MPIGCGADNSWDGRRTLQPLQSSCRQPWGAAAGAKFSMHHRAAPNGTCPPHLAAPPHAAGCAPRPAAASPARQSRTGRMGRAQTPLAGPPLQWRQSKHGQRWVNNGGSEGPRCVSPSISLFNLTCMHRTWAQLVLQHQPSKALRHIEQVLSRGLAGSGGSSGGRRSAAGRQAQQHGRCNSVARSRHHMRLHAAVEPHARVWGGSKLGCSLRLSQLRCGSTETDRATCRLHKSPQSRSRQLSAPGR